jgi:hypothetical protein
MVDYMVWFLAASALGNAVLAYRQIFKKSNVLTIDAQKLLKDITSGGAIVRIQVLDTSALFYRSPKG